MRRVCKDLVNLEKVKLEYHRLFYKGEFVKAQKTRRLIEILQAQIFAGKDVLDVGLQMM